MNKLLVHFVAKTGKRSELTRSLPQLAKAWCERLRGDSTRATVLIAHENDSMRRTGSGQPTRAFDATLEVRIAARDAYAQFETTVLGLGSRLEAAIHCDLSAVQVGVDRPFMDCEPTPIRFQYCMRRRHDFGHADYLRRYQKIHSDFGIKTQGIGGYSQFHVDLAATERACRAAGFGVAAIDSVSELHIESLANFFGASAENAKLGAQQDEDEFVDRPCSVMWISDEVFRIGYP